MKTKNKMMKQLIIVASVLVISAFMPATKGKFYKKLQKYCLNVSKEINQVPDERKKDLKEIGDYILEKRTAGKTCNLLFICTSNSRRSHMAQIWSQTAAVYYGIDSVWSYSGGTEATKVNINAINALRRCGFDITSTQGVENPLWNVSMGSGLSNFSIFSKKYNNTINPKIDFCAAMVCSEADKSCPTVDGADLRVSLAYDDPKYYDNTPSQDQKYDERSQQIATEMFFMMNYVKEKLIIKKEIKK